MTIEIDGNRLEYEFYPDIFSGERQSVTIPDSVTSIWDETFYDCRGLTSVT